MQNGVWFIWPRISSLISPRPWGSFVWVIYLSKHVPCCREELGIIIPDYYHYSHYRWRNCSPERWSGLNKCLISTTWSVIFVPPGFTTGPLMTLYVYIAVCNYIVPSRLLSLVFWTVTVRWTEQRLRCPCFLNDDLEAQSGQVIIQNSGP